MSEDLFQTRYADVRALFHALVEAAPEQRRERLAAADPALAAAVRRLLEATVDDGAEEPAAPQAAGLAPGAIVGGRYRIVRLIGEGGMGEVYLADRIDGIEQRVALKSMRGSSAALATRFVRERQILARLGHPHIAHLTDGGLDAGGTPWFAMEYVDGIAITRACDRRRLELRARVRLLVQVCRAVQFAHRNLVLHRDLKPSNILVDADGAPKLLDFGIAKLLDDTAPDSTQTVTMTPAYAAPEQLRGEPLTIASDVYQLGLVLYELLAGVPAHALRRHGALAREAGLPRLEAAYAQLASDAGARVAADRGLTPPALRRALRGDLERIVAKATAADPRERYETAQALGEDLERWLGGLPVLAQRGSFGYRFGKLLRRHAAAAAAIAVLAIGLLVASGYALDRAYRERRQRERAETVLSFVRDVFRQGDPQNADAAGAGTVELFERAARALDGRTDVDDLTRAALLREIAGVMAALGREDRMLPLAERAVALLEPVRDRQRRDYLESVDALIGALREQGRVDEQFALIARALPVARAEGDAERPWAGVLLMHRGYAQLQRDDAAAAEADLDAALAAFARHGGPPGAETAFALFYRALAASQRGEYRRALGLFEQSAAIQARTPDATRKDRMVTREIIARQTCQLGRAAAGVAGLEAVLADFREHLGDANNRTVMTQVSLALCHAGRGDLAAADAELDAAATALAGGGVLTPVQRVHFQDTRNRLDLYALRLARALPAARDNLAAAEALGTPWPYVPRAGWVLAEALLQADRCAEAMPLIERGLADVQAMYGATPSALRGDLEDTLGRCLIRQGRAQAAIAHLDRAVAELEAAQDPVAPAIVRSRIHRDWAAALAGADRGRLADLAARRAALVAALGAEDVVQVWQLDLLLDALDRQLGGPGIDAERRARAEAGLRALAREPQRPAFFGLSGLA
ncbi:MAG TPA: serine/threonine-protein kinase [Dokdonella sp.]|uniref:serine/threonine-protein kinase n=1 Tax=Dokdonella sp. TaxID=2291710 RepID=UPI002BA31B1F|nr:serine/threonine-protein kinase [Dokdonella sp.]HUD41113.1 serine/threonine-protein kinase [Dokdonella sp.]